MVLFNAFQWITLNADIILNIIRHIIDILAVWALLYCLIDIMKRNIRTLQIFKGIILVLIIKLVSSIFNLGMVSWLVDLVLSWGVVALIIVFQPEIRSMLEKMGQTREVRDIKQLNASDKQRIIDEVYEACRQMSEDHTGAIITFERKDSLNEYINSGVQINADIKSDLLLTIFMEGTRLHDGALIIQGNQIRAASAFFPQTHRELSPKYGARHRAALGISEITDALTIVVSEETGKISFTKSGDMVTVNIDEFKSVLKNEVEAFISLEGDQ